MGRIKGRRIKGRRITGIMDLPSEIMVDILSRLSIRLIFRCKVVCKLWYKILYPDPYFVKMHQTRSLTSPCIFLWDCAHAPSLLELKGGYHYYNRRSNRPIPLTSKFHFPPGDLCLVGSYNGFICLVNVMTGTREDFVYISNPLLGEYFEFKSPKWKETVTKVAYGFCFGEVSQQYKVFRLVVTERDTVSSKLEVYTLGVSYKWRNVGEVPCPEWYRFGSGYVNGAFHWMHTERNDCIYSFNVETEKIMSLPGPPGLESDSECLRLSEVGNYLCMTDYTLRSSPTIDIWWMKEYGVVESWTKDSILVNSIPRSMTNIVFEPILIWKDGEILIHTFHNVASYNLRLKKFTRVNVYGGVMQLTRYIPSFYSLKIILGDNFQITNIYPKTKIV